VFLLVPAHPGSPRQTAVKRLLMCRCLMARLNLLHIQCCKIAGPPVDLDYAM